MQRKESDSTVTVFPFISVITPLHGPGNAFIQDTFTSLQNQILVDWEWVIVENNGGVVPDNIRNDTRVTVLTSKSNKIGALKKLASIAAKAPLILELDCDDLLVPEALLDVVEVFHDTRVDFVYSDCASFHDVTGRPTIPYDASFGWQWYPVSYDSRGSIVGTAHKTPPVTEHNLRYIYYCPDHLRAWRKNTYLRVGCHDETLAVADDHDLMVRMFLAGATFKHIPVALYFYRVHAKNTVKTQNQAIQDATDAVFNKYIWRLAEQFSARNSLKKIDLCGGINSPANYWVLDQNVPSGVRGTSCNLEKSWPLGDDSVGILRANDAIEHLRNPIHTMNEAYRVLAPGGFFMIDVPSTSGKGAFCDPTHVSFWNDLSFRYYTDPSYVRFIPKFTGRFQALRVIEWFPNEWHRKNNVPYVQAQLVALKPGYEPMGAAWR